MRLLKENNILELIKFGIFIYKYIFKSFQFQNILICRIPLHTLLISHHNNL